MAIASKHALIDTADDMDTLVSSIATLIRDCDDWSAICENSCGGATPDGTGGVMMFGASADIQHCGEKLCTVECWYGVKVVGDAIQVLPPEPDPCERGCSDISAEFVAACGSVEVGGQSYSAGRIIDMAISAAMEAGIPAAEAECEQQMLDLLRRRATKAIGDIDEADAETAIKIIRALGGDGALSE